MEADNFPIVEVGPAEAGVEATTGADVVLNDLTPPVTNVVVNVTATVEAADSPCQQEAESDLRG